MKKTIIFFTILATIGVISFFILELYKADQETLNANTQGTVPAEVQKDVYTKIGESVNKDGLSIKLLGVNNDSRCPMNARCIWAGNVVLTAQLVAGNTEADVLLEQGKTTFFGGYAISIGDVKPDKLANKEIAKTDYQILFMVEKNAAFSFECADLKNIIAHFGKNIVDLKFSNATSSIQLPIAISASGARYANADESIVFWNKGNTAFVTESGTTTYRDCVTK